jgi:hypothetical protein
VIPLVSDKVNIAPDVAADGAGLIDTDTLEGTMRLLDSFEELSREERAAMRERAIACYRRRYALNNAAQEVYKALGVG